MTFNSLRPLLCHAPPRRPISNALQACWCESLPPPAAVGLKSVVSILREVVALVEQVEAEAACGVMTRRLREVERAAKSGEELATMLTGAHVRRR